jgi:L-malate glycosyltransferase
MKVLHLLYSGLGGHGNVFFSMVEADKAHIFITEALFNGIEEVRDEYTNRCEADNISWKFVKKKSGLDLSFYKQLIKAIKASKADIVFLHGSTQVIWARMAVLFSKKRSCIIVRETQANHLKTKQDWLWLSVAMLLSRKIVFLSEAYRSEIKKKLFFLYRKSKVTVIPNGINLQQFKRVSGDTNIPIIIGMQSRIVPIKDHATLLKAFAAIITDPVFEQQKIILRIAGDGEYRAAMEVLVKELGIDDKVFFLGMITETDLVDFLQRVDIYVHASFGETMSTAIMQAMACAKPIIASDVPGINNMIINGQTGILVPVKNVNALKEKISLLLSDKALAERIADNGYQYAKENFSNETMFANYTKLFNSYI